MPVDIDHYSYSIETDYKTVGAHVMLQWTTEPPTEPGLYRAIDKDDNANWVEVRTYFGKLTAWYFGYEIEQGLDVFTHWLGPLPVPEGPGESKE